MASELERYLANVTDRQARNIQSLRTLILARHPDSIEAVDQGKWFGGMLTYTSPEGMFLFAVGPRNDGTTSFHAMIYYCSPQLNEKHGIALKKFLTGKSCMKFKEFEDLPLEAVTDIIGADTTAMLQMWQSRKR
jgi:hypothetical protein